MKDLQELGELSQIASEFGSSVNWGGYFGVTFWGSFCDLAFWRVGNEPL